MPETVTGLFRDLTVDQFVERLASSDPVPGGGSASAVAGSVAAGLVAMVAALSEGRPRYAEHAALHAQAQGIAARLADRLLALADEDAAAYAAFAAALKLPRESDAEKATRTAAVRAAARVAAEVPLRCVEACLGVVTAAEALAGRSNANASSDLGVAALLGEAAARGAAANVLVNVPSIGDDAVSADLVARTHALVSDVARRAAATRAAVDAGEARPPLDPGAVAALEAIR
ncbi:MAG TPA: cyclodeaminase/cyclohydrolase family protein [Candidatus Limnocylindrales bacterium]|nr:cyclodeaminase/cyclohydrolase family protein [Candidatus Limnocylindrales bacterium]